MLVLHSNGMLLLRPSYTSVGQPSHRVRDYGAANDATCSYQRPHPPYRNNTRSLALEMTLPAYPEQA